METAGGTPDPASHNAAAWIAKSEKRHDVCCIDLAETDDD